MTEITARRGVLPLKWPQKPFALTASWKQTEKVAQLIPVESSLGMDEGRESDRDVAVVDISVD